MTTLKEVAQRAGVSIATVSKVLSNTPYFTEETRSRVMEAVDHLGYVPNLAARALSKGKTHNVCVIFPYNFDHLFNDPFIMETLGGIEAVCTEYYYNILLSTPRIPVADNHQYKALIQSGYFDGAIVFETLMDRPVTTLLDEAGYVWVAIGYHTEPQGLSSLQPQLQYPNSIHADDFGGAKMAATHLLELGHRNIGIITVEESVLTAAQWRMDGYRAAFQEYGINFEAAPKRIGNFSEQSGFQATQELLQENSALTAILCLNDRMAFGTIDYLHHAGLQIGTEISVVGFDDILQSQYVNPPLTTIKQPAHEMGQRAASLLFELIDVHNTQTKSRGKSAKEHQQLQSAVPTMQPIVFPTSLIIRKSTGKPVNRSD